jgi:hypothetical protein
MVTSALALVAIGAWTMAVLNERRMHRHRQPGVSYSAATFRRDGGWRRGELFSAEGLAFQRKASGYGIAGVVLMLLALAAWIVLGGRG